MDSRHRHSGILSAVQRASVGGFSLIAESAAQVSDREARMNQRGQALIEATFLLVVLFGILGATAAFARWFLIHQKLIIAAREAAMLYSSGHFTESEVKRQVADFLCQQQPKLDANQFKISVGRH